MPLSLILLIAVLVLASTAAVYVLHMSRQRRAVFERASGRLAAEAAPIPLAHDGWRARLARWLQRNAPESWGEAGKAGDTLVHAGFDGAAAPVVYNSARLASAVLLPLALFTFGPQNKPGMLLLYVVCALVVGVLAPPGFIARKAQWRQAKIRRSLPDSLDLLVVCVEAGVSLDAAILRVSREMEITHPELYSEFVIVNRKVNAGITRDAVVHGRWKRTGVEELRGLE